MSKRQPNTNPQPVPDDQTVPHIDFTFNEDVSDVENATEMDATDIGNEERGSQPYTVEERLRQSMFASPQRSEATANAVLQLILRPAFAVNVLNFAQTSLASHEISHDQYLAILVFVVLPLLGVYSRKKGSNDRDNDKEN